MQQPAWGRTCSGREVSDRRCLTVDWWWLSLERTPRADRTRLWFVSACVQGDPGPLGLGLCWEMGQDRAAAWSGRAGDGSCS